MAGVEAEVEEEVEVVVYATQIFLHHRRSNATALEILVDTNHRDLELQSETKGGE